MRKRAFPPPPTRPQLMAVYPALFYFFLSFFFPSLFLPPFFPFHLLSFYQLTLIYVNECPFMNGSYGIVNVSLNCLLRGLDILRSFLRLSVASSEADISLVSRLIPSVAKTIPLSKTA